MRKKTVGKAIFSREQSPAGKKLLSAVLLPLVLMLVLSAGRSSAGTEQDLRDAILGERTFTQEQLTALDLNKDGKVDASDMVKWLQTNKPTGPVASFAADWSVAPEGGAAINVTLRFNQPYTGTVKYTLGGTATPNRILGDPTLNPDPEGPPEIPDYAAPSGQVAFNNQTSATVSVQALADAVFEGTETVVLSLLPGKDYSVWGAITHTVYIQEASSGTSFNYQLVLYEILPGTEGDVTQGNGVPETLNARNLKFSVTQGSGNAVSVVLQGSNSPGFPHADLPATEAVYSGGRLSATFRYTWSMPSFVFDPPLQGTISYSPDQPLQFVAQAATGGERLRPLLYTLNVTLDDFAFPRGSVDDPTVFTGQFYQNTSGSLPSAAVVRYAGQVVASLLP